MSEGEKSNDGVRELVGSYEYNGDGEWYEYVEVNWDDSEIEMIADSVHYQSVPRDVREVAYAEYGGDRVIVAPEEVLADD
jgi:hypothetical protein